MNSDNLAQMSQRALEEALADLGDEKEALLEAAAKNLEGKWHAPATNSEAIADDVSSKDSEDEISARVDLSPSEWSSFVELAGLEDYVDT